MTRLLKSVSLISDISPAIKRMDSLMIEANIRKMGCIELLYTCLANLVHEIAKDGRLVLEYK
jgi:hypothetical protein